MYSKQRIVPRFLFTVIIGLVLVNAVFASNTKASNQTCSAMCHTTESGKTVPKFHVALDSTMLMKNTISTMNTGK